MSCHRCVVTHCWECPRCGRQVAALEGEPDQPYVCDCEPFRLFEMEQKSAEAFRTERQGIGRDDV